MSMEDKILNEEQTRTKRLEDIRAAKINPYPSSCQREQTTAEAKEMKEGSAVIIAGRLVSKREMGRLCFSHIQDDSGRLQAAISEKELYVLCNP